LVRGEAEDVGEAPAGVDYALGCFFGCIAVAPGLTWVAPTEVTSWACQRRAFRDIEELEEVLTWAGGGKGGVESAASS